MKPVSKMFLIVCFLSAFIFVPSITLAEPKAAAHGNATIDFGDLEDEDTAADGSEVDPNTASASDKMRSKFFHDAGVQGEEATRKLEAAKKNAAETEQMLKNAQPLPDKNSALGELRNQNSGAANGGHLRPSPWGTTH